MAEHQKRNSRAGHDPGPATEHNEPTKRQVCNAAIAYVKSGLSLIPIAADGTKRPAFDVLKPVLCRRTGRYHRPWGGYKLRRPTVAEVRGWFRDSDPEESYGIAVLGGKVSRGLETIDLDNADVARRWTRLVERRAPGLLARLVRVKTPRPGMHVYFRSACSGGNCKLACVPETDPSTCQVKPKAIIEVKGEGGYVLAPPSPRSCHSTSRAYTFLGGKDLTEVPTISAEERETLLSCCCEFDECRTARHPRRQQKRGKKPFSLGRPGDDFNARADWATILEPHGWQWVVTSADGSERWCRPDKPAGTSATTNYGESDLLYVFSSNAHPFQEDTGYTKFHAFALLNHHGDFKAAARALRDKGYGRASIGNRHPEPDPFEWYARYAARMRKRNRRSEDPT